MQRQAMLVTPTKGLHTNTEYMPDIKSTIDTLALLNSHVDFDELSIRIMKGLGTAYSEQSHAIQVHDTPIAFEELFEKLLNYEAQLNISGNTSTKSTITTRKIRIRDGN